MKPLRKSFKKRLYQNKKRLVLFISIGIIIIAAGTYGLSRLYTRTAVAPQPEITAQPKDKPAITPPKPAEKTPTVATPQQLPAAAQPTSNYPVHENIIATVFWVGEGADSSNDYIHNSSSAWATNWVGSYGGVDDPTSRCGYRPCAFTPKENTFYFALPFNDQGENGPKTSTVLKKIPWYNGTISANASILKNHWIEVQYGQKVAYAQWEDVGPFGEDDIDYVFGANRPTEQRAGLDLSPALADYLGIDGRGAVSWRFIDAANVPNGEWTKTVTTSGLQY